MDDLARFCCWNPDRPLSRHPQRRQPFDLRPFTLAKDRFSERKGTALFHGHLPQDQARAVFQHLGKGCDIRPIGRLVGVHRDTVVRLAWLAGQHPHDAHDATTRSWLFPPRTRGEVVLQ